MADMIQPNLVKMGHAERTIEEIEKERNREDKGRKRLRQAQMRSTIAALYAGDNTIAAIIEMTQEEFGLDEPLSVSQVKGHIKAQVDYWRIQGLKHIDDKQALVLARIDQIEELATNAYFLSMQGRMTYNFERQIERAREQKTQEKRRERIFTKSKPKDIIDEELWAETGEEVRTREAQEILEGEAPNGNIEDFLVTTSEKLKEYKRFEDTGAGDAKFLAIMLDCVDKRCKLWGLYIRDKNQENPDSAFAAMSDTDKFDRIGVLLQGAKERLALNPGESVTESDPLAPQAPLGGFLEEKTEDEQVEAIERPSIPYEEYRK